jgi:hypothetical protein
MLVIFIYNENYVCRTIEFSAETSIVMVPTISPVGLKNFLQADLLSGNLVPRFHHFLHLWPGPPST